MDDNEEEEENDNYPMFSEHGGTTMGEDEAEEEPIIDEPDDDFGRAILDAQINSGSENERLKLESMLAFKKIIKMDKCVELLYFYIMNLRF